MLFLKSEKNTSIREKGMFRVNRNLNRAQETAAAHRENLHKLLQRRLEVARANGDEALIRQLEAEASYLHLQ